MAEYIDKDLLLEEVLLSKKRNPHYDSDIRKNHDHEHDHFVAMLCKQPTADVREVRRGKWVESVFAKDFHKCSECEGVWNRKFEFCPSCGAEIEVE